jgi:hypothetical protein
MREHHPGRPVFSAAADGKLLCRWIAANLRDMLHPVKYCMFTQCFAEAYRETSRLQTPNSHRIANLVA